MKRNKAFFKIITYLVVVLSAVFFTLFLAEVILSKVKFKREIYSKKNDPEPFTASINSQGFRVKSADIVYNKDCGNNFRIICLGDSFTYGFGVADDKTYPVFLEKYLGDISRKNIQVINAGVCGATIIEELDMYIKNCTLFKHNLVVLLFQPADISYDLTKLLLPKAKKRGDSDVDDYFQKSKVYSLIKLKMLDDEDKYVSAYYHKHREYIINQYVKKLKLLNEIVESQNSTLVVVSYSQHLDDTKTEGIQEFCLKEHIPVIDIHKEYAQRSAQGDITLAYHHNETGNVFLAKLIAEKISKRILEGDY